MKYPANELWGNGTPVCPYCKSQISTDDWYPRDGEEETMECPDCHMKFMVYTHIGVKHSTVGDCALNGQLPHELVKKLSIGPFTCVKCHGEIYDWELEGGQYQHFTKDQYNIVYEKREGEDDLPF